MQLLIELLNILESDKSARAKVYHQDYVKTKDEPYRQHESRPRRKKRPPRRKKV